MARIGQSIKSTWNTFVYWLEFGNLLPLLVLVSAWHYARVLQRYDPSLVAVAIGLLVDIGIFRAVIIAVRYTGDRKREITLRWSVALLMTAISLLYHASFYGLDIPEGLHVWAMAIPLPVLIAALAYFERSERRAGRSVARPVAEAVATVDEAGKQPVEVSPPNGRLVGGTVPSNGHSGGDNGRPVAEPNPAMEAHIEAIREQCMGDGTFANANVREWCGVGPSHATNVLNYGRTMGIIVPAGHNRYKLAETNGHSEDAQGEVETQ